ncbi:MAG: helicase-related protein [Myxococcota bacterium]
MGTMPIDALRERFDARCEAGARLVVSAPTGSGKSTRLPLWMADALGGLVLVVEPRRVAARALAGFVASLDGSAVGERVGYRVRFDAATSDATQILFVTPGMALSMLAGDGGLNVAGVLVDEFHERSWEIDLITALAHAGRFGEAAALVVCSATLEVEALAARLGAEHLEGTGRSYDVAVEFDGDGGPRSDDLAPRVAAAVAQATRRDDGDVLVFVPGKREISDCSSALAGTGMRVVPLHGGLPPGAMAEALRPAKERRVFVSTNVAETSLTIPSITVVIDTGLVRRRVHRGGKAVLAVVPISGASAEQRRGRAGRVQDGTCIRLWSSAFALEPATPPELERCELDDVLLRAGMCGVQPADVAALPWVTAPPGFALEGALARLRSAGAVDVEGRLTDVGRAQARLPVSSVSARLLADAPAAVRGTMCEVVALVEVGRDLLEANPSGSQAEARAVLFDGAVDEVDVGLRCLRTGRARVHGLRGRTLEECRRLAASLRRTLGVEGDAVASRADLVQAVLRAAPDLAFLRRARADKKASRRAEMGEPWGNGVVELMVRPYQVPHVQDPPRPARAGAVLEREWLGMGQRARGVGRLVLRCKTADLLAAGLGEVEVEAPKVVRSNRKARVVGRCVKTFAGVELDAGEMPLEGAALRDALVALILRGTLLKGVAAPMLDGLHAWSLLHEAASRTRLSMPPPPEDAHTHLASRLDTLGVAELGDLELLEADDVIPDPVSMAIEAGLDPRDATSLPKELPRRLEIPGGRYACVVSLAARSVELHPVEGTKKEPAVGLLPRFRGFSVTFVKASRRQRLR